jgi:hypothetical protein
MSNNDNKTKGTDSQIKSVPTPPPPPPPPMQSSLGKEIISKEIQNENHVLSPQITTQKKTEKE